MSRGRDTDVVYPLFDVPGTGFRDREDSAMYNQYHKIGWQATWTADGGLLRSVGTSVPFPPIFSNACHDFRCFACCVPSHTCA